jgi:putative flippase GtrA
MKYTGLNYDAIRFLVAGALNTALSYGVYWLLLIWLSYQAAYAMSWVFGLLLVVILYPSKVFVGSQNSRRKQLLVIGQYLVVFCAGLGLLAVLVDYFSIAPTWAAIVVMGFTTALNFGLMRLLYRHKLFSDL